jgi:ectoine hydroxylase-related dioxygenase (phytanoyl-CoA dioxygenase family)
MTAVGADQDVASNGAEVAPCPEAGTSPIEISDLRQSDLFWDLPPGVTERGLLTEDDLAWAVKGFCLYGLIALGSVIPQVLIDRACVRARANLAEALARAESKGFKPGSGMAFHELCERGNLRYDLQHGMKHPEIQDVLRCNSGLWMPIVYSLLGPQAAHTFTGMVISCPGCEDQHIHSDGPPLFDSWEYQLPPHCLNVFIPLVDLDEENGATVLYPASHLSGTRESAVRSVVPRGSVLLFDYRLSHQGMANRSEADRPVLYKTFSRSWYVDRHNFPQDVHLFD